MKKVARLRKDSAYRMDQIPDPAKELKPRYLGPVYDVERHGFYVRQLEIALSDPRFQNIALTGPYGAGKSSILKGLESKLQEKKKSREVYRPIFVSLASFDINNSIPTPEIEDRLQNEILKQFIYRENPAKMTKSQFRGIVITPFRKRVIAYLFLAILFLLVYLLFQSPGFISDLMTGELEIQGGMWPLVAVFFVVTVLVGIFDYLTPDKPRIKGLSIGPGRLELDNENDTYFDKYIAEIIYYFQVSKTNVVIFEDLDRFNNPNIFESLRELNHQINLSLAGRASYWQGPRGKTQGKVRFVYALKDSIFGILTTGASSAENVSNLGNDGDATQNSASNIQIEDASPHGQGRSSDFVQNLRSIAENRTKFFDLIIPVVPFSTHRTAYEFLHKQIVNIAPDARISRELLSMIGSSVTDHRLLINIAYEYAIFRRQVVSYVSDDKLLAMIAYKNTNADDFEKISLGESNLDRLASDFNEYVHDTQRKVSKRIKQLQDSLKIQFMSAETIRALNIGLIDFITSDSSSAVNYEVFSSGSLTLGNEVYSCGVEDEIRSFWLEVVNRVPGEDPLDVEWRQQDSSYYHNTVRINAAFLKIILNSQNASLQSLDISKKNAIDEIAILQRFSKETRRSSIKLYFDAANVYSSIAIMDDLQLGLEGIIANNLAGKLSRNLVQKGFLDTDFYLGASMFEEGLSTAEAQHFLVSKIERVSPSPYEELSLNSSVEVCREISRWSISTLAGAANASFLLYLAQKTTESGSDKLINTILDDLSKEASGPTVAMQIVHAVLLQSTDHNNEAEYTVFRALARSFPKILDDDLFELLESTDEVELIPLVDSVLREAEHVHLTISKKFMQAIQHFYARIPLFGSERSSGKMVSTAVEALRDSGGLSVNIEGLSQVAASEFAKSGLIRVSAANLHSLKDQGIVGSTLVAISKFPELLKLVANSIESYSQALRSNQASSIMPGEETVFLESVLPVLCNHVFGELDKESGGKEERGEDLVSLLSLANDTIRFKDIRETDPRAIRALLKADILEPNLANIALYLLERPGRLDDELVELLNREETESCLSKEGHEVGQERRSDVISKIMQPKFWKGGEEKRLSILTRISNEDEGLAWGRLGDLTPEKVRTALKAGFIEDSVENFDLLIEVDENEILAPVFLENSNLNANDLVSEDFSSLTSYAPILGDDGIRIAIKKRVVELLNEGHLELKSGGEDTRLILTVANQVGFVLKPSFVLELARSDRSGMDNEEFYILITAAILKIEPEDRNGKYMTSLFRSIGGDFNWFLLPRGGAKIFEDYGGLYELLVQAKESIGTISKITRIEKNDLLKVSRRRML